MAKGSYEPPSLGGKNRGQGASQNKEATATPQKGSAEVYDWPVASGRVTSGYGTRTDAVPATHLALDVAPTEPGTKGQDINAMEDGEVIRSEIKKGMTIIEIMHPDGNTTVYNHQDNLVLEGEFVKKGQKIGTMSDNGSEGQVHLHFEVRRGGDFNKRDDPTKYMRKRPEKIVLTPKVKENVNTGSISN